MSKQTEAKIKAKGYEIRLRTMVDLADYTAIQESKKFEKALKKP